MATTPKDECWCTTAGDLGLGYGEGINPDMIAYPNPDCPIHKRESDDDAD